VRIWILVMLSTTLAFGQTKPADTVQRCRSMLNDAVHDRNPDGRKAAVEALSLVGVKDNALQSLAPMLDDHDVSVRIAVVITLGDFKDNRTLPLLKKALQDPVPEVEFAAAKVLYLLHDPDGVQFLLAVVSGDSKASSSYLSKEKTERPAHVAHSNQAFHEHRHPGSGFRSGAGSWVRISFGTRHPVGP